jgi:signal transduction histidine kinase
MLQTTDKLALRFSYATICHFGVLMYQYVSSVLAELISNAYDADAENVTIEFFDQDPFKILVSDDGNGMSYNDINDCFLLIGRNRRQIGPQAGEVSPGKGRPITGRKGIGKLAIFGIADKMTVDTVHAGKRTCFVLDMGQIQAHSEDDTFYPEVLVENEPTLAPNGTKIIIERLKREKPFNLPDIARNLYPRFTLLGPDFRVALVKGDKRIVLDEVSKWNVMPVEQEIRYPDAASNKDYPHAASIHGRIVLCSVPVPDNLKGIALYARGKLVNRAEFYGVQTRQSQAFVHMSGELHVDFVDTLDTDVITTNRDGLVWAHEALDGLRSWLQREILAAENLWKASRTEEKHKKIGAILKQPVDQWVRNLPPHERPLARRIMQELINQEQLNLDKARPLVNGIREMFEFNAFKSLAKRIHEADREKDLPQIIASWEAIEARESQKLSLARIETIQRLQELFALGGAPAETAQKLLKTLPWVFGPEATQEQTDPYFSHLLARHAEKHADGAEGGGGLEVLALGFVDSLHVVALKSPEQPITPADMTMLGEYKQFLTEQLKFTQKPYQHISLCLVGAEPADQKAVQKALRALSDRTLFTKSYRQLLEEAKQYYQLLLQEVDAPKPEGQ